jgi:hypothetical protein
MATININGVDVPSPTRGLTEILTTAVNNGRNMNAEMIGERVGRDQYKIDNLEWRGLWRDEWAQILQLTEDFFFIATIPDMRSGGWITLKMYRGDATAQPYWLEDDGNFKWYESCKMNIIDCGII